MLSKKTYERLDNLVNKIWNRGYTYDIDNVRLFMSSKMCLDPVKTTDLALSQKRNGDYEKSIINYLDALEGSASAHFMHALPPGGLRDMSKVLIAANEYTYAYDILLSIFRVMVNYETSLNKDALYLLQQTKMDIIVFGGCAKKHNINQLLKETASYSGNPYYSFVKPENKIIEELDKINAVNRSNGLYEML